MTRKLMTCGLITALMSACAHQPGGNVMVDYKTSVNGGANYATDLNECQQYAAQIDPAGKAVAGAIIGALLGIGMGALARGSFGTGATEGVGTFLGGAGAAAGAAQGAGQGMQDQATIVRNCLRGRGYTVLN